MTTAAFATALAVVALAVALAVALGAALAAAFGFAAALGFAVSAAVVLAGFLAAVATLDSFNGDGGEKIGADYAMFVPASKGSLAIALRVDYFQRPPR
jgi:hypothetical protein